jgi:hypothetical protein
MVGQLCNYWGTSTITPQTCLFATWMHTTHTWMLHTACMHATHAHTTLHTEIGTLSVIAITLRYIFALSYNVLTLWRKIIASISYRSEHIGAIIASYSYRSKLIDQRHCFCYWSLFLIWICFSTSPIFFCVQKYRIDLSFSPNKLLITCNMCSHNEIIEHIYFKYFIAGSKIISVQHYSVIAITLLYKLRYRITLYNSIAKLSFLNVIALGTQKPLSHLKVIALSKFEPLSLLTVILLGNGISDNE